MRRTLLALSLLLLAGAARAQVEEVVDVIYEPNDPPTVATTHALLSATHSDSVVATPVLGDLLYFNGTGWARLGVGSNGQVLTLTAGSPGWADAAGGGGGAPTTAQYWTGAADGTLSAEKNLGALSTGLVLNTSGVPSQYAGTSCTNQVLTALDASGAGTCSNATNAMFSTNILGITKLAFAATDKLACRDTAGAGAGEECGLTSPLNLDGSQNLRIQITTTNDGGAIVKQASTPGTQQTGHENISGTIIAGGAITAGTGLTATTGGVTASAGDITGAANVFAGAGSGLGFTGKGSWKVVSANDGEVQYLTSGGSNSGTKVTANAIFSRSNAGTASTEMGALAESPALTLTGASTNTSMDIPAGVIVMGVTYRINTDITGVTGFQIGDTTTATRFCATQSTLTSGTTGTCLGAMFGNVTTTAAGPTQATVDKVKVTAVGGTFSAGVIRIVVHYIRLNPPTS